MVIVHRNPEGPDQEKISSPEGADLTSPFDVVVCERHFSGELVVVPCFGRGYLLTESRKYDRRLLTTKSKLRIYVPRWKRQDSLRRVA